MVLYSTNVFGRLCYYSLCFGLQSVHLGLSFLPDHTNLFGSLDRSSPFPHLWTQYLWSSRPHNLSIRRLMIHLLQIQWLVTCRTLGSWSSRHILSWPGPWCWPFNNTPLDTYRPSRRRPRVCPFLAITWQANHTLSSSSRRQRHVERRISNSPTRCHCAVLHAFYASNFQGRSKKGRGNSRGTHLRSTRSR